MIDRLISAVTCGLGLAVAAGAWRDPESDWPFWLAVVLVAWQLGGLVVRPPGYRPEGTGALPPVRVERQPSSVRPPER